VNERFQAAVIRATVALNLAAFLRALAERQSLEAEGAADALVNAAAVLLDLGTN
jgi:hypothetical protein